MLTSFVRWYIILVENILLLRTLRGVDFDFNNTQYHNCAVDTKKMGIILKDDERCKIGMVELKNKLLERLGLTIDEQEWVYHLDEFMKDIK